MKNLKYIFGTIFAFIAAVLIADEITVFKTLTPAVTLIAANSTNTGAGTTFLLNEGQRPARIYLTASGIAATTNGSLIVKFSGSYDSNTWDTASLSNIKLTMSSLGLGTNTVSDWFETAGIKYIRAGQIENTFAGAVSNIAITISYPAP